MNTCDFEPNRKTSWDRSTRSILNPNGYVEVHNQATIYTEAFSAPLCFCIFIICPGR